jgi:hypothetical protein|tara:strand:+ start:6772 stop:8586 length:1815 start_codon:yes stop_codon:yes gene_type:complete
MSYVQVANLDFTEIKSSLKEYLRSNSDFTDYDFEGSTLSTLLDVLAYNTYYTAFNANMVVNEAFLESATLRDNVVSLAKQIGYLPKSSVSPTAVLNIDADFSTQNNIPAIVKMPRGSQYLTRINGTTYSFITAKDYVVGLNSQSIAKFEGVEIKEGNYVIETFTFNAAIPQRFILQNAGIDTSTLKVTVRPTFNSTSVVEYRLADNIIGFDGTSQIFFLQEGEDERYEIIFGDGTLGKKLDTNNYIEVSYITTNGAAANAARVFSYGAVLEDQVGGNDYAPTITLTTTTAASGGESLETVDSIKRNAPKFFNTQNRAVTADDYESIIRRIFPAIADIVCYGGEDASPPEYGKVKIVVKPSYATKLSAYTKNLIATDLKKYAVVSVTPEIVDPSITYVELNSNIFYNKSKTTLNESELKAAVINSLTTYRGTSDLEKFNGRFKYSRIVGIIDATDESITSNETEIKLRKDFIPVLNTVTQYEICYQNVVKSGCSNPSVQSSGFVVAGYPSDIVYLADDQKGNVYLYKIDPTTQSRFVLNAQQGTIDYSKGEVMLNRLNIIKGTYDDGRIELRVSPTNKDIYAYREAYLSLDLQSSVFLITQEALI